MKKCCIDGLSLPRRKLKKAGLIMRLTLLLTISMVVNLYASTYSQNTKLSLNYNDIQLKQLFERISEQSEFRFIYNNNLVNDDVHVSVRAKDEKIDDILEDILHEAGLGYRIVDKHIIVFPEKSKNALLSDSNGAEMQQAAVSGKVTDELGNPLPGVSISIKGTTQGTISDGDGKFTISITEKNAVLKFSFIGMISQEIPVDGKTVLNVTLRQETIGIEEVVAIGYGTSKKEDLSAAVSTIQNLDKLKDRPVLNTASLMQGHIPGVTVVNNGGHPNQGPSITIRGTGSKTESVLYVVNGVPGAPFNPSDVESVTVLKDAASAAIYGAHAGAAGVILITTRQAKEGKPSVEYSGFYGVKSAWRLPQSLSASEEAQVSNLAYTNAGLTPLTGWDNSLNPYAQVTRTDWVNEIFRTATVQRHNVTINGGTDKMSNLFQVRYENEDGTLLNTFNKNISLRFNSSYEINKYLKFKEELFWNNNDNRGTDTQSGYTGTILSAIYMPRSATPYYEDGSFGGVGPLDSKYLGIHGDVVNPVATLMRNQSYVRNSDIISTSELHLTDLIKGLEFTSRFSYRAYNSYYKYFETKRTEPGKPNNRNSLTYSTGKDYHWLLENTINYNRIFGKNNINLMVSSTSKEDGYRGFGLAARDFNREDDWAQFLVNAQTFTDDRPWDGQYEDRNLSYVGRAAYSYANRYYVTGSYRRDIAGRLAVGNRAKDYPGLTAAWKITSEPGFNVPSMDLLKVRASWGKIGNLGSIGRYYGYPNLTGGNIYQVGNGAPYTSSAYISSAYNSTLTWETSEQTDLGVDMLFFRKRLSITADYFKKKTYDLIKQQDTEWTNTYGVSAPYINQGEISNEGYEFAVNYTDKAGELTYDLGFNLATLENKVTYIDENPNSYWAHGDSWRGMLYPFRSKVGEPYYSYWLVKSDGIFQSDAEAKAYKSSNGTVIQPNAHAGDLKFIDQNDDGKIDDSDRTYMGNAFPKMTYGFSANFNWKNWDMSLFFQGVNGVKLFHAFKESTLNASEQGYNRWNKILDAWSTSNTGSDIPRISASDANKNFGTPSDWYLEKGDYLRLKTLLVGYTFKRTPWDGTLRLYFSGENLLTFTKYSGMDPEVGGYGLDGGQYPVSRVFSFGAKLNF
jgi:TonB-linked SusC/RagA family outer membrane protein